MLIHIDDIINLKLDLLVVVEIIIVLHLVNDYKLLDIEVDVIVWMKYMIVLFCFDIFDIETSM